jgi:hypothetical protein
MASADLLIQDAPDTEVARCVRQAVATFLECDGLLLITDANERSVAHRLAFHLTGVFPDWDVDCEYNRKGFDLPKVIFLLGQSGEPESANGSRVFPDIVVHRRTKPENLLVIEIKKSTSHVSDDADLQKLRLLREQLGYTYALFLRFVSGSKSPDVERAVWC